MTQPLAGRVALVTGAGRGIGRATALELARLGAAVALLARSAPELEEAAAAVQAAGGRAFVLTADVGDVAAAPAAVERVAAELGPVDVLINNAGVLGPLGVTAASDPAHWSQTIAINLTGAYAYLRATLPGMLERGWGRIVNVSSGAALGSGVPNLSAYSVSKAGMDLLSRAVAAEIAGSGVTVNAVYPGIVETAMQVTLRTTPEEQLGAFSSSFFRGVHARGELIGPADSARLIGAMVLSDLNGEVIAMGDERSQGLMQG
ncbi:MAG: hypothetical protein OHK0022_46140 [Roseiflexaceae bacterium]